MRGRGLARREGGRGAGPGRPRGRRCPHWVPSLAGRRGERGGGESGGCAPSSWRRRCRARVSASPPPPPSARLPSLPIRPRAPARGRFQKPRRAGTVAARALPGEGTDCFSPPCRPKILEWATRSGARAPHCSRNHVSAPRGRGSAGVVASGVSPSGRCPRAFLGVGHALPREDGLALGQCVAWPSRRRSPTKYSACGRRLALFGSRLKGWGA